MRASNNPFSSPVRVKKENGSWHGLIPHSIKIGRNKKLHAAYFSVERLPNLLCIHVTHYLKNDSLDEPNKQKRHL
jgi:hypothetical protein